ncbi:helix-turn-helix domain-containing protein [Herminiimonas aquatilis]|uniref:Helix-turn-helix domain-containing protein n=1 Tax=Herminiimonas aquatilis TaxID=345342 RepID=A0ABW2J474_9BURK
MRTNAGFSQIRVARDSSLARGYYGQIENSKKPPPPVSTLRRITAALRLSDVDTQRLIDLAATERGASLVIPDELPKDIVQVLRQIAQKAYRLSPSQLRRIEAAIAEEPLM